jgi:hypothetical protein
MRLVAFAVLADGVVVVVASLNHPQVVKEHFCRHHLYLHLHLLHLVFLPW